MSFTNNYSRRPINEIHKNFEFLEGKSLISSRTYDLQFKVDIDLKELHQQAAVFATNYETHGHINHYKVMRIRREKVIFKLYELYIYSFVKSLYSALYYSNLNEKSKLGWVFTGHCGLFNLLRSSSNSGSEGNIMLSYKISLGTGQYKAALFMSLLSKFKFLRKYKDYSMDSFGTTSFYIPEYESYMNYLREDSYSSDHILQGENENKEDKKNRVKKTVYTNGKLSISELNSDAESIIDFNNTPIMNAFQSSDSKVLYFITVMNGKEMEFNPSFSFNKANFIKLANGYDFSSISRCYNKMELEGVKHLVCSEVFTNTGIKCRNTSIGIIKDKDIKIPNIDKFVSSINNLGDRLTQAVEYVSEYEQEYSDLLELLNDKFGILEKAK